MGKYFLIDIDMFSVVTVFNINEMPTTQPDVIK